MEHFPRLLGVTSIACLHFISQSRLQTQTLIHKNIINKEMEIEIFSYEKFSYEKQVCISLWMQNISGLYSGFSSEDILQLDVRSWKLKTEK